MLYKVVKTVFSKEELCMVNTPLQAKWWWREFKWCYTT
jgi:hypothetical protein